MMQARRENAVFAAMVETGKKLDKIEERKRKRGDMSLDLYDNGNEKSKSKKHPRNKVTLLKPMNDGTDQAAKAALLGSLL